ncbi:MAG: pseudouridine synthase [Bacilli bacterium]
MRLDRFLATHGFCSRNSSKKIINSGRVAVNDKVTTVNDMQISGTDIIKVDGQIIENIPYATIIINKPQNFMCSMIDEKYPSVMNLIPDLYQKRVRMVGRLDADTTGLLILTDNGVLNARLAHPKYEIDKTYAVTVNHILRPELIETLKQGNLDIGRGEFAASAKLVILDEYHCEITVHEGKYHEVKRIFGKFNYDVVELKRISFGPIELGDLEEGKIRLLTSDEYESLLVATRLKKEEQL